MKCFKIALLVTENIYIRLLIQEAAYRNYSPQNIVYAFFQQLLIALDVMIKRRRKHNS